MKCNNCGAYNRVYTKESTSVENGQKKVITYFICSECNHEIKQEVNYYTINYPKDPKSDRSW